MMLINELPMLPSITSVGRVLSVSKVPMRSVQECVDKERMPIV